MFTVRSRKSGSGLFMAFCFGHFTGLPKRECILPFSKRSKALTQACGKNIQTGPRNPVTAIQPSQYGTRHLLGYSFPLPVRTFISGNISTGCLFARNISTKQNMETYYSVKIMPNNYSWHLTHHKSHRTNPIYPRLHQPFS